MKDFQHLYLLVDHPLLLDFKWLHNQRLKHQMEWQQEVEHQEHQSLSCLNLDFDQMVLVRHGLQELLHPFELKVLVCLTHVEDH